MLDCKMNYKLKYNISSPRLLLAMMFYQNRNNIFFEIEIPRHKYKINIVKTKKRDNAKQVQECEQHKRGAKFRST